MKFTFFAWNSRMKFNFAFSKSLNVDVTAAGMIKFYSRVSPSRAGRAKYFLALIITLCHQSIFIFYSSILCLQKCATIWTVKCLVWAFNWSSKNAISSSHFCDIFITMRRRLLSKIFSQSTSFNLSIVCVSRCLKSSISQLQLRNYFPREEALENETKIGNFYLTPAFMLGSFNLPYKFLNNKLITVNDDFLLEAINSNELDKWVLSSVEFHLRLNQERAMENCEHGMSTN